MNILLLQLAVYTVNIPEDASIGTTVLVPISNDRDSSSNKELSFAITSGNDQVTFSQLINITSTLLKLRCESDPVKKRFCAQFLERRLTLT